MFLVSGSRNSSDGPGTQQRGREALTTSCQGSSGQLSQSEQRGTERDPRRGRTAAKMSSFPNKFGGYTMTQLNEFLEDDEKLTKMVHEMDEVRFSVRRMLASYGLRAAVFFLVNPLLFVLNVASLLSRTRFHQFTVTRVFWYRTRRRNR